MKQVRLAASVVAGGLIVMMALMPGRAVAAGAQQWATFRGDIGRSGRAEQGIGDQPEVVWSCEIGGSVDGSPIVVGNAVYVGNSHGRFVCVDKAGGKIVWEAQLDGAVCSAAASDGNRLVVGTAKGFIYCLANENGQELWRIHCWDAVVASPLLLRGLCFVGSMDGVFHAVRMEDGRQVWARELSGGISAAAASDGRLVFVADEGGTVWAIRPEDGSVVWKRETGCPAMAAPVVGEGGLIVPLVSPTRLAPPKVRFLQMLRLDSGEVLWAVREARSIFTSPLLGPKGIVYVSVEGYLSETFLRCRSADGRVAVFKQRIGGVVDSSPAMAGGRAYFGAHDGCLYVADIESGAVISKVKLAPKIYSSPALVGGRLLIGASDGRLYCLK